MVLMMQAAFLVPGPLMLTMHHWASWFVSPLPCPGIVRFWLHSLHSGEGPLGCPTLLPPVRCAFRSFQGALGMVIAWLGLA